MNLCARRQQPTNRLDVSQAARERKRREHCAQRPGREGGGRRGTPVYTCSTFRFKPSTAEIIRCFAHDGMSLFSHGRGGVADSGTAGQGGTGSAGGRRELRAHLQRRRSGHGTDQPPLSQPNLSHPGKKRRFCRTLMSKVRNVDAVSKSPPYSVSSPHQAPWSGLPR